MSFLRLHFPRLGWHTQLALGKRASNYCHALMWHLLVDDEKRTMTWSFVIPGLLAWVTVHPTPVWRKLALWLANGEGEQARYGVQHTCYDLELFWRRVITLPNRTAQGGWSWLHLWPAKDRHGAISATNLTGTVSAQGNAWAAKEGVSGWQFELRTRVLGSSHWWLPDSISHRYVLSYRDGSGCQVETSCLQPQSFQRDSLTEAFTKVSEVASRSLAGRHL